MYIILIVSIILVIVIGLILLLYIFKIVNKGLLFVKVLGNGDLIYLIESKNNDEFGKFINVLNYVKEKMKILIENIID